MKLSLVLKRLNKIYHALRSKRLLKALVLHRVLAGVEHRHIIHPTISTIVDIGANRGQFALAAKNWAPTAMVIGFEPLADAAECFLKIFSKDPCVILHHAAVGLQVDDAILHVSNASDSSSLLPFTPLQEHLFPGTHEIRTETVNVGPLSNYVRPEQIVPPAMLKLDVQGYELEALRGCEGLMGMFSYVYVECSFVELYAGQALADDVIVWLQERGWCLSGIYNMTYDRKGRSIQADFWFQNLHNINGCVKDGLRSYSICTEPSIEKVN